MQNPHKSAGTKHPNATADSATLSHGITAVHQQQTSGTSLTNQFKRENPAKPAPDQYNIKPTTVPEQQKNRNRRKRTGFCTRKNEKHV